MEKQIERIYNNIVTRMKKIHNGETTNVQLQTLGRQLFGTKFIGVFPSDKIPKIPRNKSCILNTDPSYLGGQHWVALARSDKGKLYFYDTFARNIKEIIPALQKKFKGEKIYYDTKDTNQHPNQSDCGVRCLSWLVMFYNYGSGKALLI